jgi:hypothetical protein
MLSIIGGMDAGRGSDPAVRTPRKLIKSPTM